MRSDYIIATAVSCMISLTLGQLRVSPNCDATRRAES